MKNGPQMTQTSAQMKKIKSDLVLILFICVEVCVICGPLSYSPAAAGYSPSSGSPASSASRSSVPWISLIRSGRLFALKLRHL